jgi:hypothetical protein
VTSLLAWRRSDSSGCRLWECCGLTNFDGCRGGGNSHTHYRVTVMIYGTQNWWIAIDALWLMGLWSPNGV